MNKQQEKLLWITSIAVAATGAYLLFKKVIDRVTAEIKYNRLIIACRQDQCQQLSGTGDVAKFDVPLYDMAFYTGATVNQVAAKLNSIKAQYGALMSSVASLTNLPETLIRGFCFIESAGAYNVVGGKSIGLMQIDPVTAHGMIFLENKKGRLSEGEKSVLSKYLGSRLDLILKDKWMNQSQHVTNVDLFQPEFNLLVGSIYLGILVDECTEGNVLRLDKIVARYNRGYFSKSGLTGDLITVYNAQPIITKNYILKLAGTNGVLDIMTTT